MIVPLMYVIQKLTNEMQRITAFLVFRKIN